MLSNFLDFIYFIYLFILLLCKPHVEYKNTDNDWNHIRPASLDLNWFKFSDKITSSGSAFQILIELGKNECK